MTNNIFVNAVQTAAARRWCMRPGCTTCGATEYRAALARVAGPLGGLLCDALCDLDPADLMVIPEWDGALQIAMRHLPVSNMVRTVLEKWLTRVGTYPRFDDVVLYSVVRGLDTNEPLRHAWVRAAIPVAVELRDRSLVETLLLILGRRATEYPQLVSVGVEFAGSSSQIQRVLRNACGVRTV